MHQTEKVKLKTKAVAKFLERHDKRDALIKAGKRHRDSLLRALIPLYVTDGCVARLQTRAGDEEITNLVTCGVTQRIWRSYGVEVQSTVMAKALREHVGYARLTKNGYQITPNGIRYVQAALR